MAELKAGTTIGGYRQLHEGISNPTLNSDTTINANLTVNGTTTVNGEIHFDDVSRYWLSTQTNWGLYWDTSTNQLKFRGSGQDKVIIDLDDGTTEIKGVASLTYSSQYPLNINGSDDGKIVLQGSSNPYIRFREGTTDKQYIQWSSGGYLQFRNQEDGSGLRIRDSIDFTKDGTTWYSVWHSGNHGSNSGLDADLLDGQHGSYYTNQSNLNAGTVPTARLSGTYNISISGNAQTQSKLQTQRTISLSGDVSGSANFDGSGDITISTTVQDNSHNHQISNITWASSQNLNLTQTENNLEWSIDMRPDSYTGTYFQIWSSTKSTVLKAEHDTGYVTIPYKLIIGSTSTNHIELYTESGTQQIADTFADTTTYKNYIYFYQVSTSNDPAYIMHETSDSETNEGVLHLCPSDDNAYGDYVSIHGTNDPDVLKLHTDGTIEGVKSLTASGTITQTTFTGSLSGNASTQSKLATQRTITLSGAVTGSASFDGSQDITISTSVNHNHDSSYVNVTGDSMSGTLTVPTLQINDSNTKLVEGGENSVRIQTNSGYIDIGPQNTSWQHLDTDRSNFYFGKSIHVNGNIYAYNTSYYFNGSSFNFPGGTVNGTQKITGDLDMDEGTIYYVREIRFDWTSRSYNQEYHSIVSKNASGTLSDAIRINSYGDVVINIDSNNNGTNTFSIYKHGGTGQISSSYRLFYVDESGYQYATKVYGAVYNDYQEYRIGKEEIEAGYIAVTDNDGKIKKCDKDRARNIAGVVSDVFGFAIGEVDGEINIPIQVAGRVLIYQQNKEKLKIGDQVCQTKDGRARKMKWWEKIIFPEQIVGYVDEIPDYEEWGNDKIKVNGRVWIRLR